MQILNKYTPRWLVFLIDIFISVLSIIISYLLRFNFNIPDDYFNNLLYVIILVISIRSISFIISKVYSGVVRYTSTKDSIRVFSVVLIGSVIILATNVTWYYLNNKVFLIPLSIIIIDFLVTLFFMISGRLFIKTLYLEITNPTKEKTNVIIYGAGEFGVITKRALERDAGTKFNIVAFIDSNNSKNAGKKLEDVPIVKLSDLTDVINKHEVSTLIFADNTISKNLKSEIIDTCLSYGINVLTIPKVDTWINGELSFNQIRNIKIEDLLERDPINLSEKKIRTEIINKTILVTGAAGSIGSEIVKQLTKYNPKNIILYDQAESQLYDIELTLREKTNFHKFKIIIGDVTNKSRLNYIFNRYKPNIVYHAAAYKHVPMMENNPVEAVLVNIQGTKNVADTAVKHDVEKFVMVSTDKAVNPTNVMGASKRVAEIYTQSLNKISKTEFITTRFGNVLGSNGSVIPRFREQIESGGPVTVTHPEITRFFMTIPEACQLVLEAGATGKGGVIYIFDMGKSVKIVDLAKKMISISGLTLGKDIQISFTGLRPGEKLYEELLNNKENTIKTHHEKIMIVKVREYNFNDVEKVIEELIEIAKTFDNYAIVKKIKEIVPEFISQNSVYEKLDTKQ